MNKETLMMALDHISTNDALDVIDKWLAANNLDKATYAYRLGFRDARQAAAELAAGDTELHRDIMNLRVSDDQ